MKGPNYPTKMKKLYLIPNFITAFGLCCGLFVIFRCMIDNNLHKLPGLINTFTLVLLVAMVADFTDGALARKMKAVSSFGGHFDSLSDAITFGVAPPLIVLKSLVFMKLSNSSIFWITSSSMVYTICGVLRLVRYNVYNIDKKSANTQAVENPHFTGLPILGGASGIMSLSLMINNSGSFLNDYVKVMLICVGSIFLGCMMISTFTYPSLKKIHIKLNFTSLACVGIISLAAVLFCCIIENVTQAFFVISWIYAICSAPIFALFNKSCKRTK